MDNKILMGGVPPGAGAREDVVAMFTELEDARHVLSDVQVLLDNAMPDGKVDTGNEIAIILHENVCFNYLIAVKWIVYVW